MTSELIDQLKESATEKHRTFMQKLVPNIDPETILGVKVPVLRRLAKDISPEFLHELPHSYFEENMLHVFVLNTLPLESVFQALEEFLPYLDNWAVVDSIDPKAFYGKTSYMPYFMSLVEDERPFVKRLGIVLAIHHIKEDPSYGVHTLKTVKSDHYYVQMALAWFFADAVLYVEDEVLDLLKRGELDDKVHRKTIQKIRESRRVSDEVKETVYTYRKTTRLP